MVTTRSANSGQQRVTWAAGGLRVSPDATVNNASTANKKSLPAARRMAKKDSKKKTANTSNTPAQKNIRSMARLAKSESNKKVANSSVKKIKPRAEPKPNGVRRSQVKKTNLAAAPLRRSIRLALTNPHISSMHNEGLPTHPTGDMPDAPGSTSPAAAPAASHGVTISSRRNIQDDTSTANNEENDELVVTAQETSGRDNGIPPTSGLTSTQRNTASTTETDADITLDEYMDEVDTKIEAAKRREQLKGAIEAPFWHRALPRALYTETIRLYYSISSGRFANFQEVLDLPLDDPYWHEEVITQPIVSYIDQGVYG